MSLLAARTTWLIASLIALVALAILGAAALAQHAVESPAPSSPWINERGELARGLVPHATPERVYRAGATGG